MTEKQLTLEGRTRIDILRGAFQAGKKGAHIAPSLSEVEICLSVLSFFDDTKDSFILSKGHGALGYYAAMHQTGRITDEQFASFETDGGEFPGQPSRSINNKIEFSSGSLGMGLPYALGVALAKKDRGGRVYVIVGDGELNEGSNWEAAALAARYGLENLIVVVDQNNLQSDGKTDEITGQNLLNLWKAYGFYTIECDGHSVEDLKKAYFEDHAKMPLAVLAKTVKGKGVSFMEHNNSWHHAVLKEEDYQKSLQEIEDSYGVF